MKLIFKISKQNYNFFFKYLSVEIKQNGLDKYLEYHARPELVGKNTLMATEIGILYNKYKDTKKHSKFFCELYDFLSKKEDTMTVNSLSRENLEAKLTFNHAVGLRIDNNILEHMKQIVKTKLEEKDKLWKTYFPSHLVNGDNLLGGLTKKSLTYGLNILLLDWIELEKEKQNY